MAEGLTVDVVLGGGFMHEPALHDWLKRVRGTYTLHRDVTDMVPLMRAADLAIASFGMTAYELASQGVPGIYYCLSADHAEAVEALVATGLATNLGVHDQVSSGALTGALTRLTFQLRTQKFVARRIIDGGGAHRIAHKILSSVGAHLAHH